MTALVFVDTNIFVYARDSGQPSKQQIAMQWLARLWQEQTGRTSIQVLSEYYVTVTRKLKPGLTADDAWDDVRALSAWEPQCIDGALLTQAREVERRYRLSWWDSMVVAAAQLQSCAELLSEDMQDGMVFDRTTVRNPFSNKVEEVRAEYVLSTRTRHRKRGRPAREKA